jgi:hypothetical protein
MEIGKEYFESPPADGLTHEAIRKESADLISIFVQALQEIKEVIKRNPQREIVGPQTLTLVNIYDIIERVEEELNLKHQN